MRNLLLLMLQFLTFHAKKCIPCGTSKHVKEILKMGNLRERVIGGIEAPPHAFPWIVRLRGGCAGLFHCKSNILKSMTVLRE